MNICVCTEEPPSIPATLVMGGQPAELPKVARVEVWSQLCPSPGCMAPIVKHSDLISPHFLGMAQTLHIDTRSAGRTLPVQKESSLRGV